MDIISIIKQYFDIRHHIFISSVIDFPTYQGLAMEMMYFCIHHWIRFINSNKLFFHNTLNNLPHSQVFFYSPDRQWIWLTNSDDFLASDDYNEENEFVSPYVHASFLLEKHNSTCQYFHKLIGMISIELIQTPTTTNWHLLRTLSSMDIFTTRWVKMSMYNNWGISYDLERILLWKNHLAPS